jgi:alkylated DNA repair dioxygenase AlkB
MRRIELSDGAYLELSEHFLHADEAAATFAELADEVPWQARAIRVFGREVMQPRLVAFVGDPEAVYTYSGTRHEPLPWTPVLTRLRRRVVQALALPFNSVLCNLYRDGRDSMGMHRDAEPELGRAPVVASLSLGAARRFTLRHRKGPAHGSLDLALESGSLLVMLGSTQSTYRHGLPKQPAVVAPRINLTFRLVRSADGKVSG